MTTTALIQIKTKDEAVLSELCCKYFKFVRGVYICGVYNVFIDFDIDLDSNAIKKLYIELMKQSFDVDFKIKITHDNGEIEVVEFDTLYDI